MCIAVFAGFAHIWCMALRSKNTIMDAALLRCGRSKSGGDTSLREAMEANYDEIVRSAFEDGDGTYPFGVVTQELTSRFDGSHGYDDAFRVPDGVNHIVEVYFDGTASSDLQENWEFDGQLSAIMVNASKRTVTARMIKDGLEYTWSSGFSLGVQRRLEAVIKDFLEETEEAAMKEQEADFKFLKASVKGAKNRSNRRVFKLGGGRLSRARHTKAYSGSSS